MPAVSFVPHQPDARVHSSLRRSLKAMESAQQCSVLWFAEIMVRKVYRDSGFSFPLPSGRIRVPFPT